MAISLRQRPWGKGGGVSGVRLGDDSTLTGCGRLKHGGGARKHEFSGAVWDRGLVGVGTVSKHC